MVTNLSPIANDNVSPVERIRARMRSNHENAHQRMIAVVETLPIYEYSREIRELATQLYLRRYAQGSIQENDAKIIEQADGCFRKAQIIIATFLAR
jgi:hypothetical protein